MMITTAVDTTMQGLTLRMPQVPPLLSTCINVNCHANAEDIVRREIQREKLQEQGDECRATSENVEDCMYTGRTQPDHTEKVADVAQELKNMRKKIAMVNRRCGENSPSARR